MAQALSHLKVLDLSRVLAGPWCTQILGDLGADVIKVEHPERGDDTRGWGPPFIEDAAGDPIAAAYFTCANRNKRSIAVDLKTEAGQEIIRALAAQSDVVIENFKAGALARYGLDHQSLKALKPDLIYCSITGFGQTGPRADEAGYDFLIQAMGGLMSVTGDEAPMKVGVPIADLFTGTYAAIAILAALAARDRGLGGQSIDLALFDVQAAMLANQAANFFATARAPGRLGNAHPNIVPYQDFPTLDGRIAAAVGSDGQFARFAEILGAPEWADDPRFKTNAGRVAHRHLIVPEIASRLARKPSAHWAAAFKAAGVACGPIQTVAETFADPQALARSLAIPAAMTGAVAGWGVASPLRLEKTPPVYRRAPPGLGEHTEEVLRERLDVTEKALAAWRKAGATA